MHTSGGTTGNRAAMPDALRSRWLAPFYALVVSFLAVLLLGAVVDEPDPPTRSVDIRFVTNGQDRTSLDHTRVEVFAGTESVLTVNAEGRIDDVPADRALTICVRLPEGWSASAPARRLGDYTCWPEVAAEGRVELPVTRSGAPR
ncbi:hypothetical protein ACFYOT_36755 [Saccharothrix saharensis]|uniref:hypothetical protein n=1 Tax=Saccharothrix saharensis TaxID=571190 RepID=UPI00369984F3